MVRVICDGCGKELEADFSNVVNLDWNNFGVVGFKPDRREYNFCVDCATILNKWIFTHKDYNCLRSRNGELG